MRIHAIQALDAGPTTSPQPTGDRGFRTLLGAAVETGQEMPRPAPGDGFARARARILEIGFVAYARERQIERVRAEVLADLGLTGAELSAMPTAERARVEKLVEEEVAKRLRELFELERELRKADEEADDRGVRLTSARSALES